MGGNLRGERGFDQEIADEICELIATEGMSFNAACEKCNISRRAGHYWKKENEAFRAAYYEAKADWTDNEVDQITELWKDLDPNSPTFIQDEKKARLGIYAIQWTSGKARPHRYGDKVSVAHTGGVEHKHTIAEMTDAELEAIIAAGRSGDTGAKEGKE